MAPRNPMTDRPNKAPDPRPRSVGLGPPDIAPGLTDISTTPAVAVVMATAIGNVTGSPSSTSPNKATKTGSVLIYAMVTTNERSRIAASISAVAVNCMPAPSTTQTQ